MAFHITPDPGDPGEERVGFGQVGGADLGERRKLATGGPQVLAHGALICPDCELPIALAARVRAALVIHCGYCGHAAAAADFLREDVFDTVANEVYLVARVS